MRCYPPLTREHLCIAAIYLNVLKLCGNLGFIDV